VQQNIHWAAVALEKEREVDADQHEHQHELGLLQTQPHVACGLPLAHPQQTAELEADAGGHALVEYIDETLHVVDLGSRQGGCVPQHQPHYLQVRPVQFHEYGQHQDHRQQSVLQVSHQ